MAEFIIQNWAREEALAGDASTRRYSRLWDHAGKTAILVQYPRTIRSQMKRDIAVRSWCCDRGLRVPTIGEKDIEAGWAVIEDFGPEDAEASMFAATSSDRMALCFRALQPLAVLAAQSPEILPPWNPPLDYKRLRWELSGFELWCVAHRLGSRPSAVIGQWLDDVAAEIDHHPRRICHRDYHLNNLFFLDQGEVGVIDYQDILIGPDTYDMVSLFGERAMPDLIDRESSSMAEHVWAETTDAQAGWLERRLWVRLQRALKVLGTFGRLTAAGNAAYEPWLQSLAGNLVADLAHVDAPSELVGLLLDLGPRGSKV
jgi:aminoglycoside/choline kinase family phosphotransferase